MAKLNIHGVLAKMGCHSAYQYEFFMKGFRLEKPICKDRLLRRISGEGDVDFIYEGIKEFYALNGNVPVPPPIILKMMPLLIRYNVRSERELMLSIAEHMDSMWFMGYDLDDEIPDHSVLSKTRARWGVEAFRRVFGGIVGQCVEAGLVDCSKLFVNASLLEAGASKNSVVDRERLKKELQESYPRLEERVKDFAEQKTTPPNSRYLFTTDPDASGTRHRLGKSKLRYKTHRGIDPKQELITTTLLSPGSADEGSVLREMIKMHEQNTGQEVETAVSDSRYGTVENFLFCQDAGIQAHILSWEERQEGSGRRDAFFPKQDFVYNPQTDTFTCAAGPELRRRHFYRRRRHYEYQTACRVCDRCDLRSKCTRSRSGRTLKRHERQGELDQILEESQSAEAKKDIRTLSICWSDRLRVPPVMGTSGPGGEGCGESRSKIS